MNIAVFSDLHLSKPGGACAFTHSIQTFEAFLDHIEAEHDLILLAGDIFDHDVGERFMDRVGALREARAAWAPLVERLDQPHVIKVHGNHDTLLADEGVPAVQRLDIAGFRIEMRHGHRFFRLDDLLAPLKYPIKWAAAWDQRQGLGLVGNTLYRINDLLTQSAPQSARPTATTRGALAHLRASRGLDLLICGHDHRPMVAHTPHGIYANSGTCGYGRMDWLSIDPALGRVEIKDGF